MGESTHPHICIDIQTDVGREGEGERRKRSLGICSFVDYNRTHSEKDVETGQRER